MLAALLWAVSAAPAQPVLLIRDENFESNYETYVHTSLVRRALRRAGLEHDVIAGDKVGFRSTRAQKLVVLPCNPSLSPRAVDWLRRTVMTGARLVVFPPAPAALADLLGLGELGPVRSGPDEVLGELALDRAAVQQFPELWRQFDWNYQIFQPAPSARPVGRWSGADPTAPESTALVLGRGGAFVGANLEGDDRAGEAQLLLALATHWFAALWHEAIPGILKAVGQVGDAGSLGQIRRAAGQAPSRGGRRDAATAAVNQAAHSLDQARKLYEWGKYQSVPRPG